MDSEDWAMTFGKVLSIPVKPILWVSDWASNYAGFGAAFVKPIPVIFMLLFISYPVWSFPLWLMWSQSVASLWQYVIYVLWLVQFPLILSAGFFVGYYIVSKAKEPDHKLWDVDKSLKEYLGVLRRSKGSKR